MITEFRTPENTRSAMVTS